MANASRPEIARAEAFCEAFGLRIPILMAPMASACPPASGDRGGQCRRIGRLRRIADAARRDQGVGGGNARRRQWRVPDQPVDPRPSAAPRSHRRGESAGISGRLGAGGLGPGGRRRATRFRSPV